MSYSVYNGNRSTCMELLSFPKHHSLPFITTRGGVHTLTRDRHGATILAAGRPKSLAPPLPCSSFFPVPSQPCFEPRSVGVVKVGLRVKQACQALTGPRPSLEFQIRIYQVQSTWV